MYKFLVGAEKTQHTHLSISLRMVGYLGAFSTEILRFQQYLVTVYRRNVSILYCLLTFTNIFTEMLYKCNVCTEGISYVRSAHVFNIMERSSLSLPSYVGIEMDRECLTYKDNTM